MTGQITADRVNLRAAVIAALGDIRAASQALAHGLVCLEDALEASVQQGLQGLPMVTAPASDHRREHRPGKPRKIEGDPELQAFIAARVDRMTFAAIATEVADHFPPNRRIGKSAIHDWWRKTIAPKSR